MGRPKKVEEHATGAKSPYEEAEYEVAVVLQERCGIRGCIPKVHLEEARYLIRKFISLGIIKDA